MTPLILSFFDHSTEMVLPFLNDTQNYPNLHAYCFDLQHPRNLKVASSDLETSRVTTLYEPHNSRLHLVHWDAHQGVGGIPRRLLDPALYNLVACFFFPPCDHLAMSGSSWFKGKGLRPLADALTLFAAAVEMAEWLGAPYLIENPVSMVQAYWREPDLKVEPWEFGESYQKETWLWTGCGMPHPHPSVLFRPKDVDKYYLSRISKQKRSKTPGGFARAIHEAVTHAKAR